jgi:hypothetical protein
MSDDASLDETAAPAAGVIAGAPPEPATPPALDARPALRRRWRSVAEPCLNCGDATVGRFCPSCGQRKVHVLVSLRTILGDVLEEQLALSRALPGTVIGLLFRPGFLTREYVRGRMVRYVAPFRLYLVASVVFFLLISLSGQRALDRVNFGGGEGAAPVDAAALRAELEGRRDALAGMDTTRIPAGTRAIVRQSLLDMNAALELLGRSAEPDSAILAAVARRAGGETALTPGVRQPWAEGFQMSSPSSAIARGAQRKLDQLGHLPLRDALRALFDDMTRYAPHAVFVLLPVFAALLKLLYIRRNRFYAEHIVFALHLHAFWFVSFTLILLLPWGRADALLAVWAWVYTWLAMKRVYGQGWFRTTAKFGVLFVSYVVLLALGLLGLLLSALLMA